MKKNLDIDCIIQTIKQSVTAIQAAHALGIQVDRNGRCCCLWHTDKHPSMKLYDGDRGCYCFSCHNGGSVIDMVQQANSCSFWDAIEWLNSAFRLGLPLDRPMDKNAAEAARRAQERKQVEREQKQAIERMEFDLYVLCGRLLEALETDKERYRPRRANDEWDELFVNAVRMIPEVEEMADELAVRVIGVKNNDER